MKIIARSMRKHASINKLSIAIGLGVLSMPVVASETFTYDGYLRQEMSINMKNWEDTPGYNDRGKISMMRSTASLNLNWNPIDDLYLVAKLRGVREVRTDFLKHLEKMGANNYHGGSKGKITDLYDQNEIRELYVDFPVGDRTWFRIGKQQIAWGETDFFAANDLIHGFDNTWRSFLEPANEELRKTNYMIKANIDVPELNGGLEVFVRPGLDSEKDIGTEIDIYGGRWSSQPYAGVDFRNIDPYNFRHKDGDRRDVTGGLRWTGLYGDTNYSLSYMKTYHNSPIMNGSSNSPFGGPSGTVPTDGPTRGIAGEIIYPIVDVFGATASRYSSLADAVFSTEFAYIKDAPYNFDGNLPNSWSAVVAPGFDGYTKKDVVALMVRMDKNIAATQKWLGTEKPMFFSVQVFDKWIQNFDKDDELLYSVGWGGRVKEHSVIGTAIFDLSYNNGRVKPNLVLGADLSNGGGFAVPSVTFQLSQNLRWKVEYDAFWDKNYRNKDKCDAAAGVGQASKCDKGTLFGYLHNRDQLYTSLTYLF